MVSCQVTLIQWFKLTRVPERLWWPDQAFSRTHMIYFLLTWVISSRGIPLTIVSTLLGYVYFRDAVQKGQIPASLDEGLKVGTSAGAILGQLLFGILCDKLGRKRV